PDTSRRALHDALPICHAAAGYDPVNSTAVLTLGTLIDFEADGVPASTDDPADGDDLSGAADEDGISSFPPLYTTSTTYSLEVNVDRKSTRLNSSHVKI